MCRQPTAFLHTADSPCSHPRATASEDNTALGQLTAHQPKAMGYDIERFVGYVNDGLLCCICRDVLENPLQAPCEHAYCTSCIHGWLLHHHNCPEDRQALDLSMLRPLFRYMRNDLNRLQIRCRNREHGCEMVCSLESVDRHERECEYSRIPCTNATEACRLKEVSDMACPFLEEPVDIEAQILRRNLRRERVIRPRLDVLSFPDDHLFERYRFSGQSIIYLNNILSPHIVHMTHRGHALSSEQILCVALRFFANGSFLYNIGDAEHISKATVCRAVRNVTLALKRLLYTFIVFPSHRPTRLIKEEFHRIAGFPGVIGCIDGTHIPIIAPSVNEGDYVNRKSFHSINVQIICDAAHIISNVEAKWPGSVHDSRMFRECTLSARFARGEFDGYLLGDRGYPCQPYLLTPYPDPEPGPQQRYNLAHCRTRARVEMTIGMLKARFQCLRRLRVTPERACDIIVACVILHNIATIRGEQCPTQPVNDPDNDPDHPADARDGRAVRDTICYHHF